jgi:hypothetical protein
MKNMIKQPGQRLNAAARTLVFAATGLVLAVPPALGQSAGRTSRTEQVGIDRQVAGARSVRGRITFEVPTDWTPRRSLGHSRQFTTTTAGGCAISIVVEPAARATTASSTAQVDMHLVPGHRVAQPLGRGRRPHGSWGVDEVTVGAHGNRRDVYGVGVVHLTNNVFIHVRVLTVLSKPDPQQTCSDDDVRNGPLTAAVKRIVRSAKTHVTVTKQR